MAESIVRRQGGPDGPPTVFFHGCPGGSSDWALVLDRAGDAPCVLVDLPDHGAAAPSTLGAAGLVDEAERIVRDLGGSRVRLVGHSMGGYVVARLLERLGDTVERAVFSGALIALDEEGAELRGGLRDQLRAGDLTVDQLSEACASMTLGSEETELGARLCRELFAKVTREQWLRHLDRAVELSDPAMHAKPGPTDAVVLHGTRDPVVPLEAGKQLASLTGAKLVTVETDAHGLPLTHPDVVAAHVFPDVRRG